MVLKEIVSVGWFRASTVKSAIDVKKGLASHLLFGARTRVVGVCDSYEQQIDQLHIIQRHFPCSLPFRIEGRLV